MSNSDVLSLFTDFEFVTLLLWAGLGALVGLIIGSSKGRPGAGAFFGFLLGPIGWLIIAFSPAQEQRDVHSTMLAPQITPIDEELTALRTLFERNVISAAEYDVKRAQIAARAPKANPAPTPSGYRIPGIN